ncbi:MAG: methyltransferase domain-containing protein [Chloroflexi bacterium]|nr:methyltransferase domain-containing protein [Chloroflexota bacterium]
MPELLPDGRFDTSGDPFRVDPAALLASWGRRVRANAEQVDRFAEQRSQDHYAPVANRFRVDPRRTDDPSLDALLTLARPDETWLDIGAGGGRYALPLALNVREVIAVDPSPGMLGVLRESMAEHSITNLRVVEGRWPAAADPALQADVSFIAHVGYDVEQIGPFLEAMERSARRLCVAMLFWRRPTWAMDRLWPAVHGVERALLPAMREMVTLLMARGRPVSIQLVETIPASFEDPEQVIGLARHQTWVAPGSEKDAALAQTIRERLVERDGRYAFEWTPSYLGLVSWTPRPEPIPDA